MRPSCTTLTLILLAAFGSVACGGRSDGDGRGASGPSAAASSTSDGSNASAPEESRWLRDSIRQRAAARFRERPDSNLARADTARSIGSRDAKLWVILVGHLQNEATTNAVRELLPELKLKYVATGKIRVAFVNAPAADTDYNARFATHAAYCAALSGRFWQVFDQIAATRELWEDIPDPQPRFDSLAVRLGASAELQSLCTYRKLMMPLIMWDQERAQQAGVKQIPTVLIGERLLTGDLSLARVSAAIDAALASK